MASPALSMWHPHCQQSTLPYRYVNFRACCMRDKAWRIKGLHAGS